MAFPTIDNRVQQLLLTHLVDGFRTWLTFSIQPNLAVFEKTVTPWGMDRGEKIDQTTMHTVAYRTAWPKSLSEVTDIQATCAYSVRALRTLDIMIGINQSITITYPDFRQSSIWGFLRSFITAEHKEGEQPEINLVICATNIDGIALLESGPNMLNL